MSSTIPSKTLEVGQRLHGFTVMRIEPLTNVRSMAYELIHDQTGARVLHLHNHDAENLFSIAFRTPPRDDTGLPHILEHAVLAGSRKYPVKDPFVEMIKMSMATFINAMTYSDKTVYPVASNVKRDLFNLAEVYCDAVFHPLITEHTFKQEGHHLDLSSRGDPKSELLVKGIVYNEMKGAYSSPDSLLYKYTGESLFPDTPYGKDSGGDPEAIPTLTYENFKCFYNDLYHPSNAYIFLYGDITTTEYLAFLETQLAGFERRRIDTDIPRQPRWQQPRDKDYFYPVDQDEELERMTYHTMSWIVGDGSSPEDVMAMTALDLLLLGNAAAPLRKAIVDSQLGEDLTDSGFNAGEMEGHFHVGIKGSDPDKAVAFQELVLNTLQEICRKGFAREQVEAVFHQMAFRFLEIGSMYPLTLMDRTYAAWIYDRDPRSFLCADEHLEKLQHLYRANPRLFEELIEHCLLNNPHRLHLRLQPQPGLQAQKDAAFVTRMRELKNKLGPDALKEIESAAIELERRQSEPNTPEALATLPQLKVRDLPRKPRPIPTTVVKLDTQNDFLLNDVFSNGVNYLALNFDLTGLPVELYRYLPIYSELFNRMGAGKSNYVELAQRIMAHTGGIGFSASCGTHLVDQNRLMRNGKITLNFVDAKTDDALAVLRDLLFEHNAADKARMRDVLLQTRASQRSSLASHGLDIAVAHACRRLSTDAQLNELLGGLPQIRLVDALCESFEQDFESILEKMLQIRNFLLDRKRVTISFTGSSGIVDSVQRQLIRMLQAMHDEPVCDQLPTFTPCDNSAYEGLAHPMDIAYCVKAIPAPHISDPRSAWLQLAQRMLSLGYFWEEIRLKGGAYGGGCSYQPIDRSWHFFSYRDPWIQRTLDTFERTLQFIEHERWTQTDLERAIIGTAKNADRPIRPKTANGVALWRHVNGETEALRQERHERLLQAKPNEVQNTTIELLRQSTETAICVVSSREKLEAANRERKERTLVVEDIYP